MNKSAAARVVFSGVGKTAPRDRRRPPLPTSCSSTSNPKPNSTSSPPAPEALSKRARFALRVNPDVFAETHPYISTGLSEHKFGIDINAAPAPSIVTPPSYKWLEPAGVSVHIGSQIRSVDPFGAAASRVTDLIADLRKDGHNIRYVDAGGGLGIDYHAAQPFKPDETGPISTPPRSFRPFANRRHHPAPRTRPLHRRPGRSAPHARALRQEKRQKTFVITDAGMNDLIRPALYQAHHEIVPVSPRKGRKITADIVGPVCETGDFFARDRELPPVRPGDLLAILDAGAYGHALASNYNSRPRPTEVLVQGKRARLIRRRETTADMLATESM